jgi:hypothetical protein
MTDFLWKRRSSLEEVLGGGIPLWRSFFSAGFASCRGEAVLLFGGGSPPPP